MTIKDIMEKKGWTRKELAGALGISRRTIDGWMIGRKPNKSSIILLKHIMNPPAD